MPLLEQIAEAKRLPVSFLRHLGIRNMGAKGIQIPYRSLDGQIVRYRFRKSLIGDRGFEWSRGSRLYLYGLDLLPRLALADPVLLVEGESDCWTAWHWGLDFVLGLPGKSVWRSEWASLLGGRQVGVWQEPDAVDLPFRIAKDLPGLRVIKAPDGIKDLSEAHVKGWVIPDFLRELIATAVTVADLPLPARAVRPLKSLPPESAVSESPLDSHVQRDVLALVKGNGELLKVFSPPWIYKLHPRLFPRVNLPLNAAFSRNIACPLHTDVEGRSATLQVNRRGAVVVKCWHTGRIITIPELYTALTTGQIRRMVGIEHRLWSLRLLFDAGILARPQIGLPPLPEWTHSWETLKTVYGGAKIRAECDALTGRVGFAFALTFALRWCGLKNRHQVRAAIQTLVELEILRRIKMITPFATQRPMWVYGVGTPMLKCHSVSPNTLARIAKYSKDPLVVFGIGNRD